MMDRAQMAYYLCGVLRQVTNIDEGEDRDHFYEADCADQILSVILPQVTTEAELEALPVDTKLIATDGTVVELGNLPKGTLIVDEDGRPWSSDGWRWETRARKKIGARDLLESYGSLTVVWTPAVTS